MSANQIWFMNSLVTVRVSEADGQDGVSILEHRMPHGFSPPLHIHRTEDEILHILEGEFRVRVQDQEHRLGPGTIRLAPKGVPHSYRAESPEGGRLITITVRGDFEHFVRAVGRPAQRPELPPPGGPPSPEAMQAIKIAAAQCGIEIVGPPLS